ncbi:MAG: serine/threonine protein kinase [Planctomycetaceae bacterium]|nr:serine/threonine protein kinase [Planctomycetaceae bacterium]
MKLADRLARLSLGRMQAAIIAVCFAASGVVFAAEPLKVAPPGPESWPSFRNGNAQSGVATSTLPAKLELLWTHSVAEKDGTIKSTAAIVGDYVYVGSLCGELLCLDRRSGNRLWSYRSRDDADLEAFIPGFKASPGVTADTVYIGDEEGTFHAVDRATGLGRWKFETGGEIASCPGFYEDKVLFGSHDQSLYCLKTDGTKVWQYTTEGMVNCSPAVVGDYTFITGCDEHLRVIDIRTGLQQTDIPLGIYLIASPTVLDDMLYVGTHGNDVLAINWRQSRRVWAYPTRYPFHSSTAVNDKYVVVGGQDKQLHCLDRQTGKKVWTFPTKGQIDSSPAIVGDRVFFGSNDGNLYGLTLADRKEVFKFTDGRPFTASPAVGEGCLVIGSENSKGKIYCFGAKP